VSEEDMDILAKSCISFNVFTIVGERWRTQTLSIVSRRKLDWSGRGNTVYDYWLFRLRKASFTKSH